MTSLKNQTVVVVGGTSGIGFAVALASLHAQASHVIVVSSTTDKVSDAVKRLTAIATEHRLNGTVTGSNLDVGSAEDVKKFFKKIGEIDHVVYTSGDALKLGFKDVDLGTLKETFDVRFWSAALVAQQAQIKAGGSITLTGGIPFLTTESSSLF